MEHYICIHGHFYQPPRENPWLEEIELQDSAYPFHDWNERITTECYAPNAASRVLDYDGRIVDIANNYAHISFNIGPTLLAWIERHQPSVYEMIREADRESAARFSGHGSALAQAYNHVIMPLANLRDKRTQVRWGVRDFVRRFGREPEGLWLPEAAVDLESLEVLAEAGIRFTVLAPHQARRVRRMGTSDWQDVSGGRIDPSTPYEVRLPSGRSIVVFFYDGPVSRAVAFEGLLSDGHRFGRRLLGAFDDSRRHPQLVHIATDGESYGHHHVHGDMALAYALRSIEDSGIARLTNYGEFLDRYPPAFEAEIVENSSWSCIHGIERWRSDCGCNGGRPGWNQSWRGPLRYALDWLRDTLAIAYERRAGEVLRDPWKARDDYINVLHDRSAENLSRFFADHASRPLDLDETTMALKLLELQRHAMLMYTSCGWFFDELSGLETVQVLQYAGRAAQLAQEIFGDGIEAHFVDLLRAAPSNLPEHRDGATIYEKFVRPAKVDLQTVAAHYAVKSLFHPPAQSEEVYCYTADRTSYQSLRSGQAHLGFGAARVTSRITLESALFSFGVLHFGDHNLCCGVRAFKGREVFHEFRREVTSAFASSDLPQVIRAFDRHFDGVAYSLKSLFRDEQRQIVGPIVRSSLNDAEANYRQVYDHNVLLMRYLVDLGYPVPKSFRTAAETVLNGDLARAFEAETMDLPTAATLLEDARFWKIEIDEAGLAHKLQKTIEREIERFDADPSDQNRLQRLFVLSDFAESSGLNVNLWRVQNVYWQMMRAALPEYCRRSEAGSEPDQRWVAAFHAVGEKLGVRVSVDHPPAILTV